MPDRWHEYRMTPRRRTGAYPATVGIIAATVVVYLLSIVAPQVTSFLLVGSYPGFSLEYWRPVLYALTTGSLLQVLINGIALYFMGRGLETTIGVGNFVALFFLSGLGAATTLILAGPAFAFGGSFSAIMGIIAAFAVFKYQARQDVRGDIALLALLIVWGIVVSGASLRGSWIGDIGAVAVGAGAGAVYAYSPWRDRGRRLVIGYTALAVICLLVTTFSWLTGS
ncbi:MAG TPA: rhomboid family intramembrane serine protease [Propionibacteriaceae bacterium]|nr:rhomboid family intramembrane serine protease [Propionibacteriaceae bacterium]